MKIMVTFNDEEMRSIIDLSRNITMNSEEIKIEDEHIVGRFGEIKFDATKKEMSFDIKTAFINAYSSMILAVINMIKSLASSFEMFTSSWFEDTRDLIAEKKEAERIEKEKAVEPESQKASESQRENVTEPERIEKENATEPETEKAAEVERLEIESGGIKLCLVTHLKN